MPAGRIYTAKDIVEDPHYRARDMILQDITRPTATSSKCRASCPSCRRTPGRLRRSAPALGEDTEAVLAGLGSGDAQTSAQLSEKGVI